MLTRTQEDCAGLHKSRLCICDSIFRLSGV